jgi:hypothetical protein
MALSKRFKETGERNEEERALTWSGLVWSVGSLSCSKRTRSHRDAIFLKDLERELLSQQMISSLLWKVWLSSPLCSALSSVPAGHNFLKVCRSGKTHSTRVVLTYDRRYLQWIPDKFSMKPPTACLRESFFVAFDLSNPHG